MFILCAVFNVPNMKIYIMPKKILISGLQLSH